MSPSEPKPGPGPGLEPGFDAPALPGMAEAEIARRRRSWT